jgi:FtsZ-interacting cell division protein ZipA
MRRHDFDPVSLLSGLVIAVAMLVSALWTVRRPDGGSDVRR